MISATSPVFVTLLARIFLQEPCGVFEVLNIIVTMVGVVIVMRPPFIFGSGDDVSCLLVLGHLELFKTFRLLQDAMTYENHHFITAAICFSGTLFGSVGVVSTRALKVHFGL